MKLLRQQREAVVYNEAPPDESERAELQGPPAPWCFDDDFDYFAQMEPEDVESLNRSREHDPCVWCGGRLVHSEACNRLHDSWSMPIEFGKHKGKNMRSIPRDYLEWIVRSPFMRAGVKKEACRILGVEYVVESRITEMKTDDDE